MSGERTAVLDLDGIDATRALGAALARHCRAGDVIVLVGELGAGKTTLTRALGRALGVRGDVTSPTFVIARTHPNQASGPALQHVDAYRLPSAREFDDLDLETAGAVTVVEWGEGRAEGLSPDRLLIRLEVIDELRRRAALSGSGMRWSDAAVKALIDEVRGSAAR